MLRGIYSDLNHFSKFILLIILVFSFLLFSSLLGILALVPWYGRDILNLVASPDYTNGSMVNALKAMQILNMAGGLLLPAFIYLWLCLPEDQTGIHINKPVTLLNVFLSFAVIIIAQPLIGWANELNGQLKLPDSLFAIEQWMQNAERQGEKITEAFLSTTSISGLLLNIFMIAILPAFAEELLFRGALAGLFKDWTKNTHIAVFISSLIFAAIHLQFYGFLPRFLLGMAMGYLFFWSGSLWLPIAAHFANNFLSVIIEFLFRRGIITSNAENFGMENAAWLTAFSILGVAAVFYYFYAQTVTKKNIV